MATVEILHVDQLGFDFLRQCGGSVDAPQPGFRRDAYGIGLQGWALAAPGQRTTVEVVCDGRPVAATPALQYRGDVAAALPQVVDAAYSGFACTLSALDLPLDFDLRVEAVSGGTRVLVATVRGRRSALPAGDAGGPQPIMLTTLGRTGSSAMALLLGSHPDVLCHGNFPFETRMGAYWMSAFAALASPASVLQPVVSRGPQDPWWWLGDQTLPTHLHLGTDPAIEWMGGAGVDELATACRSRIDAFYRWYAGQAGKPGARYFVEKHEPYGQLQERLWELYPLAREVVLVRDPRDMIASILAFNRKRGSDSFGREAVSSDEAYVAMMTGSMDAMERAWTQRASRAHLVRYEDLMQTPERTLAALFSYLGVDASPAAVAAVQHTAQNADPARQDAHRTAGAPAATVGRWARDLSPSVRQAAELAFERALRVFGYAEQETLRMR